MGTSRPQVNRDARAFILMSAFINFMGIGIVNPVVPFIIAKYVDRQDSAFVVALLTTVYSISQFLGVPVLGALSDRYGRRPILLISFLGSAIGYLIFGVSGALWVLLVGRIIDGLTGGNIAAIQAYVADVTDGKDRTKFYGVVGAAGGLGFVVGPALGALAYRLTGGPLAPVYLAAAITLVVTIWGFFAMPESLLPENRTAIKFTQMNPLSQLTEVVNIRQIRSLLVVMFLWATAYAFMQANLNYFTADYLNWSPDQNSLIFFVAGIFMIVSQAVLVKRLIPKLGESRMALVGLGLVIISYMIVVSVAATGQGTLLYLFGAVGGLGVGLVNPALSGLLSQAVSATEQGRVQGGSQSLQALARVIAPLWAGWAYGQLGRGAPYISGVVMMILAGWIVLRIAPVLLRAHAGQQQSALAS